MYPQEPGISNKEVASRQKQYGPNVLPEKPPPSSLSLFVEQLRNPLIYILLFAGLVTIAVGHGADAVIILIAVIINTVLGFIQERKASDALYALKHYVSSKATVVREGKRVTVETSEIVPGDIVILDQGVKVPADGELLWDNRFYVDESVLTGESIPVNKKEGATVSMGSTVAAGQAVMRVATIGAHTQMGVIALQIQAKDEDTPLQRQLKHFSRQLVVVVSILTVLVFIVGLRRQFNLTDIFITSVALAVSSIPEGLIVSLTVVMAIGMQRILKRQGLVRHLSAAETLGGVTTICVDKTGTLTEGRMEVVEAVGDEQKLAEQIVLANDMDDPIVISAFEWGQSILNKKLPKHERIDSIPFSSEERFFMSLHSFSSKTNRIFVNGAPEVILSWTSLSAEEKKQVQKKINELTKNGKRVLGLARKDVGKFKKYLDKNDAKSALTWMGLLAFSDPVRVGVKDALMLAQGAGIRTVVVTGDYAKTSQYVLSELGVELQPSEIITGDEVRALSKTELAQKAKTVRLFARTTPSQKLAIVAALKKNGEVVAMMGDGVNDAPALHNSDIGIAVGTATDVAKESADLVLLDSNFATIIAAIEEGRAMFENIRKIILYLMSDAFGEIFVVLGSIILGLPLPLTAVQILWINIISDGFPNLALTVDPKRFGLMQDKPRSPKEKLVTHWMMILIGSVSTAAGIAALAVFIYLYHTTGDHVLARSMAFLTLGMNTLAYVFSVRVLMTPFWKSNIFANKWLISAVAAGFLLQMVPFTTPVIREFFGLTYLRPIYWVVAFALSVAMFFVVEGFKYAYNLRHAKK